MRYEWQDLIPFAVVVALIGASLVLTFNASHKRCHALYATARNYNDTLTIAVSYKCSFISPERAP